MRCHLRGRRDGKSTRLLSPEAWRGAECGASCTQLQLPQYPQIALQSHHGFTGVMILCQNILQLDLSVWERSPLSCTQQHPLRSPPELMQAGPQALEELIDILPCGSQGGCKSEVRVGVAVVVRSIALKGVPCYALHLSLGHHPGA